MSWKVKLCGKCGRAAARRREVVGIDRDKNSFLACVSSGPEKLPPREHRAPQDFGRGGLIFIWTGFSTVYSFERRESLKVDDASFKNVVDCKTNYSRPARFFEPSILYRKRQAEVKR